MDQLRDLACITAGRNLSREEWARYFPKETTHVTCPTLPLHVSYLDYAADLAASGEITAAVTAYQAALDLDPTLAITPTLEANRRYAPTIENRANRVAASGEITAAVTLYQQALDLDPTLAINPQQAANRQATQPLLDAMAARGVVMTNTQTSRALVQTAIQLADELDDNSLRLQICQTRQISMTAALVRPVCQQVVAAARELTGTTAISGVVTSQAGDVWQFSGQAGQVVTIWLRAAESGLDAYLRLYDASFALVADNDDTDNTDAALEAIRLPVDGVYLINADGFEDSRGAYVLDIVIEDETQ